MKTKAAASKSRAGLFPRLKENWPIFILALLLLFGFGLRLIDLTDPPLDFHPTRQYRGALIARSLYYQLSPAEDEDVQKLALTMRSTSAELEPPILESLVAVGYLLAGGEQLWIARVLVSFFWVLSALAVYALAARVSSSGAALLAIAYYLLLPFGVYASRSFQPDPFMVAWMALAAYALYRWSEERSWKWVVVTALSSAIAVLVKAFAVYFLGGMLLAVVLHTLGFRTAIRDRQVWAMAAIAIIPPAAYYLLNIGDASESYIQNWIFALLPLAFAPGFYVRWLSFLSQLFGLSAILAGLTGIILSRGAYRWLLIGYWLGYIVYGITLPHQTLTHNYYHLSFTLILALSLAPVLQLILSAVRVQPPIWRGLFNLILIAVLAFTAWVSRSALFAEDYRGEIAYWESVAAALPETGSTIALTQHYGRLIHYYGWRKVELWPVTGELRLAELRGNVTEDFELEFADRTVGMDYFLVTTFNQLQQQAQLNEYLYSRFPILTDGAGYIIFDLRPSSSDGS